MQPAMTKTPPSTGSARPASAAAQTREERLAAALRANLRKRKAMGGSADPDRDQHPKDSG
jgi:hypothetical protein